MSATIESTTNNYLKKTDLDGTLDGLPSLEDELKDVGGTDALIGGGKDDFAIKYRPHYEKQADGSTKTYAYEYTVANDGSVLGKTKYEFKNFAEMQKAVKNSLQKQANNAGGSLGMDLGDFEGLTRDALGNAHDANVIGQALEATGTPTKTNGEDPGGTFAKMEEKHEAEKKAWEDQFQDKIGGFGTQTFFMENLRHFIPYAKSNSPDGYGASPIGANHGLKLLSVEKNLELLIHMMGSDKTSDLLAFQQGTPEMFSALTPQVKLFFVYGDGTEAEIPFSMHTEYFSKDPTKMLESREGRGDDVGLISFDWSFDGGKTGAFFATSGGGVGKANLSLYFQSAKSILKKRTVLGSDPNAGGNKFVKRSFSYNQLLSTDVKDHLDRDVRVLKQGKIRAVIGYGVHPNYSQSIYNSAAFFKAATNLNISLNLAPAQYELDFSDSGGIQLNIEYRHTVEENLKDPKLNIFGGTLEIIKDALESEKADLAELEKISQTPEDGGVDLTKEMRKEKTEAIAELESEFFVAQNEVYATIKSTILGKAQKLTLNRSDLESYISVRQLSPAERRGMSQTLEAMGNAETFVWDSARMIDQTRMTPSSFGDMTDIETIFDLNQVGNLIIEDTQEVELHWVYLGDIFASILDQPNIKKRMIDDKMVFILGQIVLPDSLQGRNGVDPVKPVLVNLADIPIALNVWNQFFSNNIVAKKIVNLDLFGFLRMFIHSVINPMLNNTDLLGPNEVLSSNTVLPFFYSGDASKVTNMFKDTNRLMIQSITDVDFGRQVSPNPMRKDLKSNVFFISGGFKNLGLGSANGGVNFVGDEIMDNSFGIMHYFLSRDRGFLKSANFTKGSIPRSREINVAGSLNAQNTMSPKTGFWEPFNLEAELFGNPNIMYSSIMFIQPTLPGMSSFLDPNSAAYKLQIGGYHRVIELTNKVDASGWKTSLTAMRQDVVAGKYASAESKANIDRIYPKEVLS